MKIISLLITAFLIASSSYCQVNKALKVGDELPDIQLDDLYKFSSNKINLADFRGKLLILDFWNKKCKACITSFPKIEQIQKQFESKVQIILVTNNTEEELTDLFHTSPIMQTTNLPFAFNCKNLYSLFPHNSEPLHVWIDENGKVVSISDGYNTTSKTVEQYFNFGKTPSSVRDDINVNISEYQTLLDLKIFGRSRDIRYSSVFMKRLFNFPHTLFGALLDSTTNLPIGFRFINVDLVFLYKSAFNFSHTERIVFDVEDPTIYFLPKDESKIDPWLSENTYCYEVKFPSDSKWTLNELMQQDLERIFSISGKIMKRKFNCYILKYDSVKYPLESHGGSVINEKTKDGYILKNVGFEGLINDISYENQRYECPVFINETNYKKKIDLKIKSRLYDLPSLIKELNSYGLELINEERDLDALVLTDCKK